MTNWLSIREASSLLGVNPTTLRSWADRGQVRSFRTPGGHRRFAQGDLLALLGRQDGAGQTRLDLPRHLLARIRRRMSGRSGPGAAWVDELGDGEREELRQLGRRLVDLAADYTSRPSDRIREVAEAREIGGHYGRTLAAHGMPFSRVLEAFIFFRDLLEQTVQARPAYRAAGPGERDEFRRLLSAVLDQVLLGAVTGYEATALPSLAGKMPALPGGAVRE